MSKHSPFALVGPPTGSDTTRSDAEPFSVRVRLESAQAFVTLIGDLTRQSVDLFERRVFDAQSCRLGLVVDLRALTSIDLEAVRVLLAARLRAIGRDLHLEVVCAPGEVRAALRVSGLDRVIAITEPPAPRLVAGRSEQTRPTTVAAAARPVRTGDGRAAG